MAELKLAQGFSPEASAICRALGFDNVTKFTLHIDVDDVVRADISFILSQDQLRRLVPPVVGPTVTDNG